MKKSKKILFISLGFLFAISGLFALPDGNYTGGLGCIVIAAIFFYVAFKNKIKKTYNRNNAPIYFDNPRNSSSNADIVQQELPPDMSDLKENSIEKPNNSDEQYYEFSKTATYKSEPVENIDSDLSSKYEYFYFKVAGVTFKNEKPPTRQTLLRKIKAHQKPFDKNLDVELRKYEYEGKPAYGVYVNNLQIGNVPALSVSTVDENIERVDCISRISVYGGGRDENGYAKPYGCEVTLRLHKEVSATAP